VLTPARRRGVEFLDDPDVDPAVRRRAQSDIARSNRMLGGLRAAVVEIRKAAAPIGGSPLLLDVGTGLADIPERATAVAARDGVALTTIGVDGAPSLLVAARGCVTHAVCASAFALPFRDHSVDIVMCSQLLHHFDWREAASVIRELNRVAARAVIVSDLRRSWIAAAGFWIVANVLRFDRVTRHDGVVSVLRGFTAAELRDIVKAETGVVPAVRRRLGYRLTARWTPAASVFPGARAT
jgi:2-polyprenyl-3-methyl-5-hydroxy-6-metoxy-1,4-benzoquinol methylase